MSIFHAENACYLSAISDLFGAYFERPRRVFDSLYRYAKYEISKVKVFYDGIYVVTMEIRLSFLACLLGCTKELFINITMQDSGYHISKANCQTFKYYHIWLRIIYNRAKIV